MEHVCEPVADCRICLESADHSEGRPLVVPCECAGTCKYVHRDCLEHWVLERGSSSCEVCKAPYKEEALTELGLRRLEEQRRRELEWPQHDADFGDEAMMMHRRAAPATQRLIFLSTLSMLAVVFFLAQDEDVGGVYGHGMASRHSYFEITDSQADAYLAELGLRGARKGAGPAPPSSALPAVSAAFGLYEDEEPRSRDDDLLLLPPDPLQPQPSLSSGSDSTATAAPPSTGMPSAQPEAGMPAAYDDASPGGGISSFIGGSGGGGGSSGGGGGSSSIWGDSGGGLWPEHGLGFGDNYDGQPAPLPPSPPPLALAASTSATDGQPIVPADPEEALLQLIDASGCTSEEGRASSTRTCDLAEKVLRHIRLTREATREQYAEQEAGEAMGRLTRAFILLCILRIVIAQQQRRRILLERQLAWERREAAHGRLPV